MAQLSFTIQTIQTTDFYDNTINIKRGDAEIDGKCTNVISVFGESVSDAYLKDGLKTKLTDLGFVWDSEI